ncbi:MAG: hypothetical protein IT426_20965 [Pirellulales bacterium]|nr:hypothetical protein [Pirellulales bacterium]
MPPRSHREYDKRARTQWFRSAVRTEQGDTIIDATTKVVKIEQSKFAPDEFIVTFEGGELLVTNLAFLIDRWRMEEWAIRSLEAWLEGPEGDDWPQYVRKLAGLPEPKPTYYPPPPAPEPPPAAAVALPTPPPFRSDAEVIEIGDSIIAAAIPPQRVRKSRKVLP